jgi:hypothetical protein
VATEAAGQERPPADHGFRLSDSTVLTEPNAGTMYHFERPDGVSADVYRYPLPSGLGPCLTSASRKGPRRSG